MANVFQYTEAIEALHIAYLQAQKRRICELGIKGKKLRRAPTPQDGTHVESLINQGRNYLQRLAHIKMTPNIKERVGIVMLLDLILDDPFIFYPDDFKDAARMLQEKWESQNWGADEVTASGTAALAGNAPVVQDRLPPPNHPIYGVNGIMHGIMIHQSDTGRKSYRINRQVQARDSKVYGHNQINVGTWFANQIVALHRGAHGSRMGGIAGSMETGAYSIVVSDAYDDLDNDEGDTIYYSGSNSHKNEDRQRPPPSSTGTKALNASVATRNPVRVLRSGGSNSTNHWLPDCGLRYDGLYRVVSQRERHNKKGKTPLSQHPATSKS